MQGMENVKYTKNKTNKHTAPLHTPERLMARINITILCIQSENKEISKGQMKDKEVRQIRKRTLSSTQDNARKLTVRKNRQVSISNSSI